MIPSARSIVIRWVKANIADYTVDLSCVTIFGGSASWVSVVMLDLSEDIKLISVGMAESFGCFFNPLRKIYTGEIQHTLIC